MVEEDVTARLQHLLEATWFVMAGGERCVATGAGSRPGDPLADLLFALLVAPTFCSIDAQLRATGIVPALPHTATLPDTETLADFPFSLVTWHDDLAIPISAPDCQELFRACSTATQIVHDAFLSRGLQLNTAKGKTELLVSPVGPGRNAALTRACSGPPLQVLPDFGPLQTVHFTLAYKHLGSAIAYDGVLSPEICTRLALAHREAKPLANKIWRDAPHYCLSQLGTFQGPAWSRHVVRSSTTGAATLAGWNASPPCQDLSSRCPCYRASGVLMD